MENVVLGSEKAEAFVDKMLGILNGGALTLMTSVGHRTGLFDSMSGKPPATSEQIAEASGLNERYVREWLASMVVGGIVNFDPDTHCYHLPEEHAAFLTRDASPDNLAVVAQYIPLLGQVEDQVVECFKRGGGVPYAEYSRFHEVMAEDSGQTVVAALLDSIIPLVRGLQEGLDRGIEVLDVGCGSGRALILMAREFPRSHFTGYDLCGEPIDHATSEVERLGLANVEFARKDVTSLGFESRFDLITAFDAIHDQAAPDKVLAEIAAALRDGGTFLMQDIAGSSFLKNNQDHPIAPLLYTVSCMHCMSVSLAQGGAGLGTMWGEEKAREMLREAGFRNVEVRQLDHDFQNSYYVARKY